MVKRFIANLRSGEKYGMKPGSKLSIHVAAEEKMFPCHPIGVSIRSIRYTKTQHRFEDLKSRKEMKKKLQNQAARSVPRLPRSRGICFRPNDCALRKRSAVSAQTVSEPARNCSSRSERPSKLYNDAGIHLTWPSG